tara:strand:- start:534 stop:911 length:378 start_codon:yes stop_codon:yes gene_type:complete
MAIQSTRRNPSLPRRTPAKTKVIAQPEIKSTRPPSQFEDIFPGEIPTPPGGWRTPGGVPPWTIPAPVTRVSSGYGSGSSLYTPPAFGGYTPPPAIPLGAAGVKTPGMRFGPGPSGGYFSGPFGGL